MHNPATYLAPFAAALCFALPLAAQETGAEAPAAETPAPESAEAPATPMIDADVDTVVATVNGTEITVGHMIVARARLPEQYQDLPDEVLFAGILDQLVQQTALADTFDGTLPPRVELSLENERRSLTAGEVIEQVMSEDIDQAELEAAYQAQYASAEPGQEYNAAHILVETEEEAQALKEELDNGADFAELAREKSTGPTGPSGGALGWFGKGMMVPSFEAAVVELETGEVSDPVQTQFGWHVIKLNETRQTKVPELEDVRDELEAQLRQARVQTRIKELTEAADVEREAAKSIDPSVLKNIDWLE